MRRFAVVIGCLLAVIGRGDDLRVWLLDERFPDNDGAFERMLERSLTNTGYRVRTIGVNTLAAVSRERCDVLIVPDCHYLPLPSGAAIFDYLRDGGRALFLGGPPFSRRLIQSRSEWLDETLLLAQAKTHRLWFDPSREDFTRWQQTTGNPQSAAKISATGDALRLEIPNFRGWDVFASPPLADAFPQGATLTVFEARTTNGKTNKLSVEWEEADGSRWTAVVPLTMQWQRFALKPEDFQYWFDNPSKGRGSAGDAFRPANARRIKFGLAESHTPDVGSGPHEIFLRDIGAAAMPAEMPKRFDPPALEMLWPDYKYYPLRAAADAIAAPDQVWLPHDFRLRGPLTGFAPIPRPNGSMGVASIGRWVALATARGRAGEKPGAIASVFFSNQAPFENAAWAWVGLTDRNFLAKNFEGVEPMILSAMRALTSPRLAQAGTARFSYWSGEPIAVEGRIENPTAEALRAEIRARIVSENGSQTFMQQQFAVEVGAGARVAFSAMPPVEALVPGFYQARVELLVHDKVADIVTQPFSMLREPSEMKREKFVSARDGQFWLAGKPWSPHGVNYWPLYVSGMKSADFFAHWTHPSLYAPEEIEKDLGRMQWLGVTAVSIQFGGRDHFEQRAAALNDFLARCARRAIKVNLFLDGADFRSFDPARVRQIIEGARLGNNPTIWAYDIAWEPHLGRYAERRHWDAEWARWIDERYGNVFHAERDWEFPCPRAEGRPTSPSDAQLTSDGPHRKMVAAYRRFVDDFIGVGYGRVTRFIQGLDSNHLLGARTGYGGNGNEAVDAQMPFDLASGAQHLDFISPEGYALSGDWQNFAHGGFTTAYARWAGNGKPVFWAEFGWAGYPKTSEILKSNAANYENFYRMLTWTRAQGSAAWWWPGGYRVDEKSDFGIIDPDGMPRPAAQAMKRWARKFPIPPPQKKDGAPVILIDRDLHPRGYSQVWARHRDTFVSALEPGRSPIIATEATGKNSTFEPIVAVGGGDWNGDNPPKYLNAEFNWVRVRPADSDWWIEVRDGDKVQLKAGVPFLMSVSVGNTGEVVWAGTRAAGSSKAVYLAGGGLSSFELPLETNVGRYRETVLELSFSQGLTGDREAIQILSMSAGNGFWFGQRLNFHVKLHD